MRIGIISDTHGLLRPEALAALGGSDIIIHAGDIGRPEVLERLNMLAPVHAVRGNIDTGAWAQVLPEVSEVIAGHLTLLVLHDISQLDMNSHHGKCDVVVFGHSHVAVAEMRGDVLYLNPGSAGPRRFRLPVTLAILDISGVEMEPRIVTLT
jgi:putative phosphoesterase